MGWGRPVIGFTPLMANVGGGTAGVTFNMTSANACWSARFTAPDTRDIASVWVNFSAVTAGGTVQLRIETDSSGKPSGSLYDANASKSFTPTVGWQQVTFNTLPTTGLTADTLFHVVLITTAGGTLHTLRAYWAPTNGSYPINALTATDGTTRTNLAENNSSVPVCTVVFEDSVEESVGFAPFASSSNFPVYGTRAAGLKFTVPTGITLSTLGVVLEGALRTGTPDDLRVRVLDSGGGVVSGATVVIPRSGLLNAGGRRVIARFPAAVSLVAGTYRVVCDQWNSGVSSTNSSNAWTIYSAVHRASGLAPSYLASTTTTDVTVGSPTWTDTATDIPLVGVQLNDVSAPGGGGVSGSRIFGGM